LNLVKKSEDDFIANITPVKHIILESMAGMNKLSVKN